MNKKLKLLALTALVPLLVACGNSAKIDNLIENKCSDAATAEESIISSVETEVPAESETTSPQTSIEKAPPASAETKEAAEQINEADEAAYDLDFTKMGSNMVYAEIYAMMYHPYDYVGKTIRVTGNFTSYYREDIDVRYYYVLIKDALACCQQGVEFIWDENTHKFPDEFPEDYADIELCGTIYAYEEEDITYSYIEVDDIKII